MACGGRLRRLQPHPCSFPPRSRRHSQSSHHAVSSSPACRHASPCIRPPSVLRRPCLLDVVLGHDIQKVEGEALLGACLRAHGRVLVIGSASHICLEHALHGFAELAWPSPLVVTQVVAFKSVRRLGLRRLPGCPGPACADHENLGLVREKLALREPPRQLLPYPPQSSAGHWMQRHGAEDRGCDLSAPILILWIFGDCSARSRETSEAGARSKASVVCGKDACQSPTRAFIERVCDLSFLSYVAVRRARKM